MSDKQHQVAGKGVAMGRIGHRPFWVLALSVFIRAIHQIGAAVFLAVFLLADISEVPVFYSVLVTVSGLALLFTEWLRHRQLFRELAGIVTIVKILILGAAMHGFLPLWQTVLVAFFFASIGSHAPKNWRHRILF